MKLVIVKLVLLVAIVVADEEAYDNKYDNFDVDPILANVRLMKGYGQCFLDKGNCTPDGKNFKKWIPNVVKNQCTECNAKQKALIRKVMLAVQETLPEVWEEMRKKYDPEEKNYGQLDKFIHGTD